MNQLLKRLVCLVRGHDYKPRIKPNWNHKGDMPIIYKCTHCGKVKK